MSVLFGFALAEFTRSHPRPPEELTLDKIKELYDSFSKGKPPSFVGRNHKLEPGGAMEPREDAEIEMEERIAIAKERGEDIPLKDLI